jgi:hypothetical protein
MATNAITPANIPIIDASHGFFSQRMIARFHLLQPASPTSRFAITFSRINAN